MFKHQQRKKDVESKLNTVVSELEVTSTIDKSDSTILNELESELVKIRKEIESAALDLPKYIRPQDSAVFVETVLSALEAEDWRITDDTIPSDRTEKRRKESSAARKGKDADIKAFAVPSSWAAVARSLQEDGVMDDVSVETKRSHQDGNSRSNGSDAGPEADGNRTGSEGPDPWENTGFLSEDDMHVFGSKPLLNPVKLVSCPSCSKPILISRLAQHTARCTGTSSVSMLLSEAPLERHGAARNDRRTNGSNSHSKRKSEELPPRPSKRVKGDLADGSAPIEPEKRSSKKGRDRERDRERERERREERKRHASPTVVQLADDGPSVAEGVSTRRRQQKNRDVSADAVDPDPPFPDPTLRDFNSSPSKSRSHEKRPARRSTSNSLPTSSGTAGYARNSSQFSSRESELAQPNGRVHRIHSSLSMLSCKPIATARPYRTNLQQLRILSLATPESSLITHPYPPSNQRIRPVPVVVPPSTPSDSAPVASTLEGTNAPSVNNADPPLTQQQNGLSASTPSSAVGAIEAPVPTEEAAITDPPPKAGKKERGPRERDRKKERERAKERERQRKEQQQQREAEAALTPGTPATTAADDSFEALPDDPPPPPARPKRERDRKRKNNKRAKEGSPNTSAAADTRRSHNRKMAAGMSADPISEGLNAAAVATPPAPLSEPATPASLVHELMESAGSPPISLGNSLSPQMPQNLGGPVNGMLLNGMAASVGVRGGQGQGQAVAQQIQMRIWQRQQQQLLQGLPIQAQQVGVSMAHSPPMPNHATPTGINRSFAGNIALSPASLNPLSPQQPADPSSSTAMFTGGMLQATSSPPPQQQPLVSMQSMPGSVSGPGAGASQNLGGVLGLHLSQIQSMMRGSGANNGQPMTAEQLAQLKAQMTPEQLQTLKRHLQAKHAAAAVQQAAAAAQAAAAQQGGAQPADGNPQLAQRFLMLQDAQRRSQIANQITAQNLMRQTGRFMPTTLHNGMHNVGYSGQTVNPAAIASNITRTTPLTLPPRPGLAQAQAAPGGTAAAAVASVQAQPGSFPSQLNVQAQAHAHSQAMAMRAQAQVAQAQGAQSGGATGAGGSVQASVATPPQAMNSPSLPDSSPPLPLPTSSTQQSHPQLSPPTASASSSASPSLVNPQQSTTPRFTTPYGPAATLPKKKQDVSVVLAMRNRIQNMNQEDASVRDQQ
mmetsp:Transcript_30620/g.49559  ORF Transcript_30620/g.49559 Transcript_30620/m.49559 type:complete len:1181 (+) Transcript_30620:36-3578(+)